MADLVPAAEAPPPALAGGGSPLDRLRGFAQQGAVRKALPFFLGSAAIGGAALAWSVLSPAPQRVLYSELSDAERAHVVAALDKAGIGYKINSDTGTLTVGEDDLYKARMLVASDASLAAPDANAALDNLPLGASRTLEGERLRAAREHELELTIQQIEGVEGARVHLAEAAHSVFVRDDAPPTASVMVRMAKGRQLGQEQVRAIVNLVAGSVPGMAPESVRVADQQGRLLSEGNSPDANRIELQARLEDKLHNQLEALLLPMLGAGNFSSEVQVELDMDQVTSARESYDKNGGVLRSETQSQSQSSGPGATPSGVPGALANTPPPSTVAKPGAPQGTPSPAAAPGAAAAVNGESTATRNYELGREVSVANASPGKIKRLSVAVALSQSAMKKFKPADVDAIKSLVAAAVGADPARGDQVQVQVRPFEPADATKTPFYEAPWFAMVLRYAVALIAVVLVLLLGVRPLIRQLRGADPAAADPEAPEGEASEGGEARPEGAPSPTPAAIDTALLNRQVSLAQRIVEEKPEDALLALRQMLGEAAIEAAP